MESISVMMLAERMYKMSLDKIVEARADFNKARAKAKAALSKARDNQQAETGA